MALSDLAVFSEYTYEAMTEVLAQEVDKFNAASGGAIVLQSAAHQGDFTDTAFWAKVSGLVRRRNAYGAGAVAAKTLQHLTDTMVKVAAGTPPVQVPPSQFTWIQRNPEEGGAVYGQQLAKDTLADMLNTAILAAAAAMEGEASVETVETGATPTLGSLLTAASKFGDRAGDIRCWVLHSKTMFDLFGQALANANSLFNFGTVAIQQDGFGRPYVVTDSPSLFVTNGVGAGVDLYRTLGLTTGAIQVDMNNDFDQNIQTSNGDENIQRSIQSEWTYNLGMKGYAWDKTAGGKSPNDAALATANNWDRYATSHKDTMGVYLKTR